MNKGLRTSIIIALFMPIVFILGAITGGLVTARIFSAIHEEEKAAIVANYETLEATHEARFEKVSERLADEAEKRSQLESQLHQLKQESSP